MTARVIKFRTRSGEDLDVAVDGVHHPAVQAIKEIHRKGRQPFNEARPTGPWIERHEYQARVRNGRLEFREGTRRGAWSKKLPGQQFLEMEERKFRGAQHRASGQARASAAGVTARRKGAEGLADRIVAEFNRLGERVPPMPIHNRTAEIARLVDKSKVHVMNVLVDRGLRAPRIKIQTNRN
ncbi:hypothetical protein [Burkholderia pseudomallei]|uniref:Uncharacterized protein n=2 Tax=Pseudomonadota TaxID=1224 RepID=Q63RT7_BURPS|nr:hypothetical protein [Burkholderia pseudomallei]EIF70733.1 hypothetical protein BP354E_5086 [Burkholderia pseudomallei 354e]EIF71978.1 hypothetical protein BP354A_6207 [Burkholderia pseudomallei 354a]MDE3325606.1 hypothetical protein [Burkholderia pseudomallei]MDY7814124.1 hypothetical protein [Burkholderia pseudomallei]MDY7862812.1 hypothetical protein [Burkholderia pseudomallei]